MLEEIFVTSCNLPSSDRCPVCNKHYKITTNLKNHIVTAHPEMYVLDPCDGREDDTVTAHTRQLIKVLLLKRCLDFAIKTADGQTLSLLMKQMTLYFRHFHYNNYASACFEHTAEIQLLLSPRMRKLIQQEAFVNNRGGATNNLAMDLDLEHSNRFFKDNFTLKSNDISEAVLERLSFAQDKLKQVIDSYAKEFGIHRHTAKRHMSKEDYNSDVEKLRRHLSTRKLFTEVKNRKMHSVKLMQASHDPLMLIDMYNLKQWFKTSLARCVNFRFLK